MVFIKKILQFIPLKYIKIFFDILIETWQQKDTVFLTYHSRPMYLRQIGTNSDQLKTTPKIAILLQGPIIHAHHFTYETIQLYRQHYPDALIILSTWDTEDVSKFDALIQHHQVDLVLNQRPEYAGMSNINLQIVSSSRGVLSAQDLGAEYVLKTRTDQRLHAPNIFEYFLNLLTHFPVVKGFSQKKRLIGLSINTFKYRLYDLSDMNIFGHIDDMVAFWSADLDNRRFSEAEISQANRSIKVLSEHKIAEIYLVTEFFKKINRPILWTLEDSWQAFADHFIVADKESVDLFWPKYQHTEFRWLSYDTIKTSMEMNFREWFNIYQNLHNKKDLLCRDLLDMPFQ